MGALAAIFSELPPPWPRPRLGALGGSYFSASVAARGLGSPYDALIESAAASAGVDPHLVRAIISAESAWKPDACSTSSCGLMQINYLAHGLTRTQVLDPTFNVPYGARVIAEQLGRRGSIQLALAGYNAGTGRSDADLADRVARDVNGVGTYVQTVLDYLTWFQTQAAGTALAPPPDPSWYDETPAADSSWAEPVTETLAGVEPWMWWALGGAAVLTVALVVARRRRR